jgi:Xaa-Pro aminopeptidase
MHGTAHWLGLDTHDECLYGFGGKPVRLRPGMVFTVEPGIYIHEDLRVPKKWKGIGVRIEDDVLVTKKGHRILTEGIPKEPDEIEAVMARR